MGEKIEGEKFCLSTFSLFGFFNIIVSLFIKQKE
jgi:hypothetical protein